jgi:aminopeptidase N
MRTDQPVTIRLSDYLPPAFLVDRVELAFDLEDNATLVDASLKLRRNPAFAEAGGDAKAPLALDGEGLDLQSITIDGWHVADEALSVNDEGLTIRDVPDAFTLETRVQIDPAGNTRLEGLYRSGSAFCTQCEAEGFRRITYFPDRPDVMTKFKVTIRGDKQACPVLLSNGNLVEEGGLDGGRHYAVWEDPHPKPSYLFALVAGQLEAIQDKFTTASGKPVDLYIYTEPGESERATYAMDALIRSMKWDEEVFGLEYDLERFNIVAVSDFNMGAMENKSLNVFNSKYILADPDTATDADYAGIERVVAHEYFHNWTGNRVTCRDWFQLSLKEGLTVFRDQEFSADMRDAAVQRIDDVRTLRARQFPEDSGPTAHPIRPDSYIEINNFYTPTIYEKGAEVVRLLHSELGPEGFRKGMDLYFQRHDNQAVTCDDFRQAMADANGVDLSAYAGWYSQAGTPVVEAHGVYDRMSDSYALTLRQKTPPTPGQADKHPLPIPLSIGLVGPDGEDLPLIGPDGAPLVRPVVTLEKAEQTFTFEGVAVEPTPSINRGFSAPIRLDLQIGDEERGFLAANDADPFNRWEAMQQLATKSLLARVEDPEEPWPAALLDALARTVMADELSPAFRAALLTLPGEEYLAEQQAIIDPDGIRTAREALRAEIAGQFAAKFRAIYDAQRTNAPYSPDADNAGKRSLQNVALAYLTAGPEGSAPAEAQFRSADNMTDRLAALSLLNQTEGEARDDALAAFAARYDANALVMDKWFALQATAPMPGAADRVRDLMEHPRFSITNPNKVRALIGAFAMGNQTGFHAADGSGYAFLAEQIIRLNGLNPQIAARLIGPLGRWRKFDAARQSQMRAALKDIAATPDLAPDLFEVVSKSLAD